MIIVQTVLRKNQEVYTCRTNC